jgi:hypothetical protein
MFDKPASREFSEPRTIPLVLLFTRFHSAGEIEPEGRPLPFLPGSIDLTGVSPKLDTEHFDSMAVLPSWQDTSSTCATMTGCCLTLRERFWTALDIVPNESHRSIAVEVRDKDSRPLTKAVMVFEVEISNR